MPFKDRGTRALVVTNALMNVFSLLSNLMLARFLSPEAFAITGLATTVIFAFNMVSDGGFRAFILRHQQGDEDVLLNTLWTIKLIRNVLLAILMWVFSNEIAGFLGVGELTAVLQVLSLVFVLDGVFPIGYITIERHNNVSVVMYIRFLCKTLSMLFALVGVYYYQTYWPIVYSLLLDNALQVVLGYLWIGGKGSRFSMNRAVGIEFLGWAKYIIPSSILTLLLMQFDKFILAKALTVEELGLYFVAFNFSSRAASFCIQYARGVLEPYMSGVYRQTPQDYVARYYAKKMKISLLTAAGLGVLSGSSFVFFDLFYKDSYLQAGYYLSILLVVPVMNLITYTSEMTLVLHGQIRMTLIANMIRVTWFLLAAWFGFLWLGVTGVLLAIALIEVFPAIYLIIRLQNIHSVRIGLELLILCAAVVGFVLSRFVIFLING